jgi:hypothetical protein
MQTAGRAACATLTALLVTRLETMKRSNNFFIALKGCSEYNGAQSLILHLLLA